MGKLSLRSLLPSCFIGNGSSRKPRPEVSRVSDQERLSFSDISSPEDLSLSVIGSDLHVFTIGELKQATRGFSLSNLIGEGGFGPVYKGFVDERIRPGIKAQAVAVKLLDLEGMQGHKEWLAITIHLTLTSPDARCSQANFSNLSYCMEMYLNMCSGSSQLPQLPQANISDCSHS